MSASVVAESVGGTYGKEERRRTLGLMFPDQLRQFPRRELFSFFIQQYERAGSLRLWAGHSGQSGFVLKRDAISLCVPGDALQVFICQGLNRRLFGFANPRNCELHAGI